MAGGHQIVWCQNGGPKVAFGNGIWTSGEVNADDDMRANNFILSSDKRLKTNIQPIKQSDQISVQWKSFDFKGKKRYGVIAQELDKVAPQLVRTDENGYKSVAYIDLLVLKIAELENRTKTLEDACA